MVKFSEIPVGQFFTLSVKVEEWIEDGYYEEEGTEYEEWIDQGYYDTVEKEVTAFKLDDLKCRYNNPENGNTVCAEIDPSTVVHTL